MTRSEEAALASKVCHAAAKLVPRGWRAMVVVVPPAAKDGQGGMMDLIENFGQEEIPGLLADLAVYFGLKPPREWTNGDDERSGAP